MISFIIKNSISIKDPFYEGSGIIFENVKTGIWNASVKYYNDKLWGKRVAELVSMSDGTVENSDKNNWNRENSCVHVDAGYTCIIDSTVECNSLEEFENAKNVDRYWKSSSSGAFSLSGYGDGGYSIFTIKEDNKIVGIKIIFIDVNNWENENIVVEKEFVDTYNEFED